MLAGTLRHACFPAVVLTFAGMSLLPTPEAVCADEPGVAGVSSQNDKDSAYRIGPIQAFELDEELLILLSVRKWTERARFASGSSWSANSSYLIKVKSDSVRCLRVDDDQLWLGDSVRSIVFKFRSSIMLYTLPSARVDRAVFALREGGFERLSNEQERDVLNAVRVNRDSRQLEIETRFSAFKDGIDILSGVENVKTGELRFDSKRTRATIVIDRENSLLIVESKTKNGTVGFSTKIDLQ